MFDSAFTTLNEYIEDVTRFNFYSVDMQRGDNPEDIYYLCNIKNSWYVVYETDYVGGLREVVDDIREAFKDYNLQPQHWIARRNHNHSINNMPLEATIDDKTTYEALITPIKNSYLRCALLAVEAKVENLRFHPTTYGNTK